MNVMGYKSLNIKAVSQIKYASNLHIFCTKKVLIKHKNIVFLSCFGADMTLLTKFVPISTFRKCSSDIRYLMFNLHQI